MLTIFFYLTNCNKLKISRTFRKHMGSTLHQIFLGWGQMPFFGSGGDGVSPKLYPPCTRMQQMYFSQCLKRHHSNNFRTWAHHSGFTKSKVSASYPLLIIFSNAGTKSFIKFSLESAISSTILYKGSPSGA